MNNDIAQVLEDDRRLKLKSLCERHFGCRLNGKLFRSLHQKFIPCNLIHFSPLNNLQHPKLKKPQTTQIKSRASQVIDNNKDCLTLIFQTIGDPTFVEVVG